MNLFPQPQSEYKANISEGIFDLPSDVYFKDEGISQSSLKLIARSMAHWEAAKLKPRAQTPDMLMGSLIHAAVLEPETFGIGLSHHVKPLTYKDAKTGEEKKWNGNATFCKEWAESHDDLPTITMEAWENVLRMAATIKADELAGNALKNGHTEVAVFVNDPLTGERRKGRFDLLVRAEDAVYILDLKKTEDARAEATSKTFARWGYHIQASWYQTILADLCEKMGGESLPVRMLYGMIEDEQPHGFVFYELGPKSLAKGAAIWRMALDRYHFSKTTGKIEGYPKDIKIRALEIPSWALREEEDEE